MKQLKFESAKKGINFQTDWVVYPSGNDSSICYCTSKERAEFLVKVLNFYFKYHIIKGGKIIKNEI